MATIRDAYINALLADAAYVDGLNGLSRDDLIRQLEVRMTSQLATYIADRFTVVTQIGGLDSSFEATVWRDAGGQIYVSMRGTQGGRDVTEDRRLASTGLAREQMADMVNWWLRATTPAFGSGGSEQFVTQIRVLPNGDFALGSAAQGTGVLAGVNAITSVNGHSLGGHLATAFVRIFGARWPVGAINTFNSAGFSRHASSNIETGFSQIAQLLPAGSGLSGFSSAQNNYFAENGINVTTNTRSPIGFQQYGERIGLFQEDGVTVEELGFNNHFMYKITDLLALGDALARLDPTMDLARLSVLVKAGSAQMVASYESVLDAVRRIFAGQDITPTLRGDDPSDGPRPFARRDYHQKLNGLVTSARFQAWEGQVTIASLVGKSVDEIKSLAQSDVSYRYALAALNPFAITGAPGLYDSFNQSGELEVFVSAASTPAGMTAEYLADRARMVSWINLNNTNDSKQTLRSSEQASHLYTDIASGEKVTVVGNLAAGGNAAAAQDPTRVSFGGQASDLLSGSNLALAGDRLYGGLGDDTLIGKGGNDHLEGGAGFDVYKFATGDGQDGLRDTDAKAILVRNDSPLALGFKRPDGSWGFQGTTYTQSGADLAVMFFDSADRITLKDFDFAKAAGEGYLGVRLIDSPSFPADLARTFHGDKEDWDSDGNASNGTQTQSDAFGNTIRADGQEGRPNLVQADRADVFYGSSGTEAERFITARRRRHRLWRRAIERNLRRGRARPDRGRRGAGSGNSRWRRRLGGGRQRRRHPLRQCW